MFTSFNVALNVGFFYYDPRKTAAKAAFSFLDTFLRQLFFVVLEALWLTLTFVMMCSGMILLIHPNYGAICCECLMLLE